MNLHQYCHRLIKKSEVIILGDFNINLLKINEKEYCSEFYDTLTGFSFFPKITFPTRFLFPSLNGTLVENLFCTISELMLESTAGILIKQFSDHHPYFIFIDNAPVIKCPPILIKIHIQNEIAVWNFASEITNSNIMEKLDKNSLPDLNKKIKIITEVLGKANCKRMPYKLVKFKKYKDKFSQWITNGILESIKYRDNLHNQLKRLNPTSIEHVIKTANLKTYNSILKRSITAAKLSYYEQLFNTYKNDARKTWKTINEILNRSIKKVHYLNI